MSQSSQEALSAGDGDAVADPHAATAVAVPGVIRTAAAASRGTQTPITGYSPKLSVDMASAHRWAPYADTISALRSLALTSLSLRSTRSREQARDTVARLYGHEPPPLFAAELGLYGGGQSAAPAPFAAARRFPEGEVYVCLDRAPFARRMQGILEPLARAEAAEHGDVWEELVSACSAYARGIGDAIHELTRVDGGDPAVLYDRAVFESAFLLTWTELEEENTISISTISTSSKE